MPRRPIIPLLLTLGPTDLEDLAGPTNSKDGLIRHQNGEV